MGYYDNFDPILSSYDFILKEVLFLYINEVRHCNFNDQTERHAVLQCFDSISKLSLDLSRTYRFPDTSEFIHLSSGEAHMLLEIIRDSLKSCHNAEKHTNSWGRNINIVTLFESANLAVNRLIQIVIGENRDNLFNYGIFPRSTFKSYYNLIWIEDRESEELIFE